MNIFALWKSPRGRIFLITLIVVDIAIFAYYVRNWRGPTWQTVATDDGVASVEMPGTPRLLVGNHPPELGGAEERQLVLYAQGLNQEFKLAWTANANLPAGEDGERMLGTLAVAYMTHLQTKSPHPVELMQQRRVAQGDFPGIEVEFRIDSRVLISRTFYAHGRSYAAEITALEAARDSPSVKRYIESFQIKPAR